MILLLHNRYRTTGGEERAVSDLLWLIREVLGEEAELLERASAGIGRAQAAAGLLGGGLRPDDVARAVRLTRARVVHAHNIHPAFGWRALAAARAAGARVVLHLHQYRLVCAIGVCFVEGADCTRCHGRNTLPGLAHRCRGSAVESIVYAAGLAAWQRRLVDCVDAFIVPSGSALERLRELGAPLPAPAFVVPNVVRSFAVEGAGLGGSGDGGALVTARLAPEKGIAVGIEACRLAGVPLVVAGEGPEEARLRAAGASPGGAVRFVGRLDGEQLKVARAEASVLLAPSLAWETSGLAAAEAMAAGLPVVGSAVGALRELLPSEWAVPPGDAGALAAAIGRVRGEEGAGARAIALARAACAPEVAAPALARAYG